MERNTSSVSSTSLDRFAKDVRVRPIIIAELELGNIERHIFAAHFVERADHSAFENRPESVDRVGMDCSYDILPFGVVNDATRIFLAKFIISGPLIRAKQAHVVGDGFVDERGESGALDVRNHLRLTAPTIGVLPEPTPPVPPPPPRLSQCLFLAKPPTKVSSTSTIPPSLSMSSMSAVLTL